MPMYVVLDANLYAREDEKSLRGDILDLTEDEAAQIEACAPDRKRLSLIPEQKKRGRPRKVKADENSI